MYTQRPALDTGFTFNQDSVAPAALPELEDYPEKKKFQDEWELLGLSARKHPLTYCRDRLPDNGLIRSSQISKNVGKLVSLAGILAATRPTITSKGEVMSFLTLEDEAGLYEVTVFPANYRRLCKQVTGLGPYLVRSKVESQYDTTTLTADRLQSI